MDNAGLTVLIVGNPVDGTTLYGPFLDFDSATTWAEGENFTESWWVAPLNQGRSDNYVLVEGGLVQNDPALPVLDLDVLGSDLVGGDAYKGFVYEEVAHLLERLNEHGLTHRAAQAQAWLDRHEHLNPDKE